MAITINAGTTIGPGLTISALGSSGGGGGGGGGTYTFSAGADYTNFSEIIGGLIFFYSPTAPFLSILQSLTGTETFQYTSYGPTYTTTLTTPFSFNAGLNRWEASAVNTGGSYVDTVTFTI